MDELQKRQAEFEADYKDSQMFKDKVLAIPRDYFNVEEQKVYDKIANNEIISVDEYRLIFNYMGDYDIANNKYDTKQVVESNKQFRDIIETEQELLDFLSDDEIVFKFAPTNLSGKQVELTVVAKPISDSAIIRTIEEHEALFRDYTLEQREVINKNATGQKLTRAEQQILNDINNELAEAENGTYEARFKTIKQFIADTCLIRLPSGDIPFSSELIEKFRFNDIISLYLKLQNDLGITEDSNRELFPVN